MFLSLSPLSLLPHLSRCEKVLITAVANHSYNVAFPIVMCLYPQTLSLSKYLLSEVVSCHVFGHSDERSHQYRKLVPRSGIIAMTNLDHVGRRPLDMVCGRKMLDSEVRC